MNKREQQQFIAFFEQIYETEQLLDFIKVQLSQSSSYNPHLLFELISQRQQTITLDLFRAFLDSRTPYNQRQLYQIFERFDSTRQGFISRNDFLNQIAPFGTKTDINTSNVGTVTSQIEGHFISLIVQIIKRLRILQVARKQIKYIQPYDAFAHIDNLKIGSIGITQLRKFLYDNDFNVTDRNLYYLLHGLRRRCYKDVNLQVFCQNLDPLQFGYYLAYHDRIEEQKQKDFINRSRYEEETMKRSRLQAQRIEHQFQKGERKRQAEVQRQLELEDKVDDQIIRHEEQKERQIRRALLEEDRNIRHNIVGPQLTRLQYLRNLQQIQEQKYLQKIRLQKQAQNALLSNSALKVQRELERSRRALREEREILYRQDLQKQKQLLRSAAVSRQIESSRRRIQEESRRRFEDESIKRIDEQRIRKRQEEERYLKQLQLNRRQKQESRRIDDEFSRKRIYQQTLNGRDKLYRQLQLQKIRAQDELLKVRNNRFDEYEKELERTRYQIQERRSRLLADSPYQPYR